MNAYATLSNIPIFSSSNKNLCFPSPIFPKTIHIKSTKPFSLLIQTDQLLSSQQEKEEDKEESGTESESTPSTRRRLILLRHAKSSWADRSLRDHDRPLSKAGRADAIKISKKLQQLGWIPQLILLSDAIRTQETLKIMQEHVQGFLEAEIRFISSFYSVAAMDGQTAEHLQQAICQYSRNDILTVMCMGHNRGWEEAASMFTGASIELKTCNAALLEATGRSWEEETPRTIPQLVPHLPSCLCPSCIKAGIWESDTG